MVLLRNPAQEARAEPESFRGNAEEAQHRLRLCRRIQVSFQRSKGSQIGRTGWLYWTVSDWLHTVSQGGCTGRAHRGGGPLLPASHLGLADQVQAWPHHHPHHPLHGRGRLAWRPYRNNQLWKVCRRLDLYFHEQSLISCSKVGVLWKLIVLEIVVRHRLLPHIGERLSRAGAGKHHLLL